MDTFLKDLYAFKVHQFQEDMMIWTLCKAQGFKVSTYYKALRFFLEWGISISLEELFGASKILE